jgi:WD40 repeat protein
MRALFSVHKLLVLCLLQPPTRGTQSQENSISLARWSDTGDMIGLTNGVSADIYDSNFSLIQSFTLLPIEPTFPISFQASVWSPNLTYIHRVILFDDTYTGPSPNKIILQIWRVDTKELVFEYLGLSIRSGVIWNQQSTQFAFAVPTGLGTDSLLIFDIAGNQIAELVPPIPGFVGKMNWNSDGSLIAFNISDTLFVWDFNLKQYRTTPTPRFNPDERLRFDNTSNRIAYIEVDNDFNTPDPIIVWDVDTSQQVGQFIGYDQGIYTFNWGLGLFAGVGLDDTIRIWDSQTFQQLAVYERSFITQVQFSPDSNVLLTNGPDPSTFQTIEPLTGKLLSTNYTQ